MAKKINYILINIPVYFQLYTSISDLKKNYASKYMPEILDKYACPNSHVEGAKS